MDVKHVAPSGSTSAPTAAAKPAAEAVSPDQLDTVVCVISHRGVVENRVEPNLEAMAEAGLLVLERIKTELAPEVASVFAISPVDVRSQRPPSPFSILFLWFHLPSCTSTVNKLKRPKFVLRS
jgi:hypothetical protein